MVTLSKSILVTALVVAISSIIIAYVLISAASVAILGIDTIVQSDYDASGNFENRYVTDCIPAGPDDIVPSIGIYNQTHTFNLSTCVWEPMKNPISDENWK
ncbi:MAG: hypothetical protein V3W20_07780 [Candidatus Neomarinimicrobiota bacterium]